MALSSPSPGAAYIYMLRLDPPGIAWEYLRRDPRYRTAWRGRRRRAHAAGDWGIRIFEDPGLDARSADPIWLPTPVEQVHLTGDADAGGAAEPAFSLWQLHGPRRLFHDGRRLSLTGVAGFFGRRAILGETLQDGSPRAYAVPPSNAADAMGAITHFEQALAAANGASDTPSRQAVAHMRAFHALDATEAGMSERDIGVALFGAQILAEWHSESPIRAGVRDAVRRGLRYRDGHWRSLVWPARQRRLSKAAESP